MEQHVSKKLEQGDAYHRVASPLLLTTVYKKLGSEETSCWSLRRGVLSHSCLMQDSSFSTVLGFWSRTFHFMMHQMFLYWLKVWTSGRSVQHLNSSPVKPCCCDGCSMLLSEWNTCCSKTSVYFSALMVPFLMWNGGVWGYHQRLTVYWQQDGWSLSSDRMSEGHSIQCSWARAVLSSR